MDKFEQYEWIHSWCDETGKNDLPRVLLVGDSICNGYQFKVREYLKGICYVDYIATSYAVNLNMYKSLIVPFAKSAKYDIIHFNNGLHGEDMNLRTYRSKMEYFTREFMKLGNVILANSTIVYEPNSNKHHHSWYKKVMARNEVVKEISDKYSLPTDDLFNVSKSIESKDRNPDGFHYTDDGFNTLALKVVESIKKELNK